MCAGTRLRMRIDENTRVDEVLQHAQTFLGIRVQWKNWPVSIRLISNLKWAKINWPKTNQFAAKNLPSLKKRVISILVFFSIGLKMVRLYLDGKCLNNKLYCNYLTPRQWRLLFQVWMKWGPQCFVCVPESKRISSFFSHPRKSQNLLSTRKSTKKTAKMKIRENWKVDEGAVACQLAAEQNKLFIWGRSYCYKLQTSLKAPFKKKTAKTVS